MAYMIATKPAYSGGGVKECSGGVVDKQTLLTFSSQNCSIVNGDLIFDQNSFGQQETNTEPKSICAKSMIIFWDRSGPLYWDLLQAGQTISAEQYCQQVHRCNQAISRHYRRQVISASRQCKATRWQENKEEVNRFGLGALGSSTVVA
ncbi:hypothetical protein KIN20_011685 [Parelaphostrongylus tenuis]|uniref:Uncharacterized protein n=1 Tax=Parelaphostrongylus tenuis TaxID=148309 RepID=A0AAD5QMM7_PARTN|nr:hypothetical protein KIN20_011685 [Parelaphostrongylus tenuis]